MMNLCIRIYVIMYYEICIVGHLTSSLTAVTGELSYDSYHDYERVSL